MNVTWTKQNLHDPLNANIILSIYLVSMTYTLVSILPLTTHLFLLQMVNPYLQGQRLDNVVAKKSVPHFSGEEEE